jgi:hypothetical protein
MRMSLRHPGLNIVALLAGSITLLIQIASFTPGPWHTERDLSSRENQCPVCRTAHQGVEEAGPTIQLGPPIPTICLSVPEELPGERESFSQNVSARGPPPA